MFGRIGKVVSVIWFTTSMGWKLSGQGKSYSMLQLLYNRIIVKRLDAFCQLLFSVLTFGVRMSSFSFILHMCIPCGKTFLLVPNILTFWPWPWLLTYFWKKLNIGYNFWTKKDRTFILHMVIPCGKTFLLVPNIFTSWPWPLLLTYFWKKLDLSHNFWTKRDRVFILGINILYRKVLFVPIFFYPVTLTSNFDLLLE